MNKQLGFSLIEIMIVIAIIGVLTSVALPAYQNYVKKAEIGAALATLQSLKTNVEEYIASNGDFPNDDASTSSGELTLIGSSADAFRYGTLKSIQNDDNKTSGYLEISFGKEGSSLESSDIIYLIRDDSNNWKCEVSSQMPTEIIPRGCTAQSE